MGLRARIWMASRRSEKFLEPLVLAMTRSSRCPGILACLRKIRPFVRSGKGNHSGSCHIRKLQWRLVALTVQFVEAIVEVILVLKLAATLVRLSQEVKYPLPSIPMQQVLVTEVRDEKFGITSQRSPQKHAVFLRGDISGAQPLYQCATIVAPGFLRMISVPFWRRTFVEILLRFTIPL